MAIRLTSKKLQANGKTAPLKFKRVIKRNDSCPCKSGLKWKKCCGVNADTQKNLLEVLKTPNVEGNE